MNSTERRVDQYRVLYTWKIIQGLVPNCRLQWGTSGQRGLLVKIPPLSGSRMAIRTLKDRSFMTEAPHLYNSLPVHLREFSGSLASFKAALDEVLSSPLLLVDGYYLTKICIHHKIQSFIIYLMSPSCLWAKPAQVKRKYTLTCLLTYLLI